MTAPFVSQISGAPAQKVKALWAAAEKNRDGHIERLKCWDMILSDTEAARIFGGGDEAKDRMMIAAMKAARVLGISGDGKIQQEEFLRLCNPFVITASVVSVRADVTWAAAAKDDDGEIDRVKCWDMIQADPECTLGRDDVFKGKAMMQAMKAARALDISGDGKDRRS